MSASERTRIAAVVAAVWLLLLVQTPWTTLYDRDEPRFAQAAVEMVATGDLLVPTCNGAPRLHKPVLATWLMAASVSWLGPTPFAVRLWSPLGVALAAFATLLVARRTAGTAAGWWAVAILASCPRVVLEGVAATADAVLLAATTVACALLAASLEAPRRHPGRVLLLAAALAVGALVKGPIAPAVAVLALAGTALVARRRGTGVSLRLGATAVELALALVAAGAVFLAWAIPADRATAGAYLAEGFGHHVVARVLTPFEGHGGSFLLSLPYYLPVVAIGFAPWILFLPAALASLRREQCPLGSFLLAWAVGPLLAFTLVATKLPHYVLPAWPALAVIVARYLARAPSAPQPPDEQRWLRRGGWLLGLLMVALGGGLVGAATILRGLAWPLLGLAAVAAAGAVAAIPAAWRGDLRRAAVAGLAGTVASQLVLSCWLLPAAESLKPVPQLAAAIRAGTPASVPVATLAFAEPSLVFSLGHWPVTHLSDPAQAAAWLAEAGPGVLVTTRQAFAALTAGGASGSAVAFAAADGMNIATGRWVELVAVSRVAVSTAPPPGP